MSDEILAAFAVESAELLESIEASIAGLGAGRREDLDAVFRTVHTLKGSAGIVGLPHLEAFAHALESRLSALRSKDELPCLGPEVLGSLLACRDRLAALLAEARPTIGAEAAGSEAGITPADEGLLAELDRALVAPPAASPGRVPPVAIAGQPPGDLMAPASRGQTPAGPPPSTPQGQTPAGGQGGASYSRVSNAKLDAILEEASELVQSLSEFGRSLKVDGLSGGGSVLAEELLGLHALASRHYRTILEARTIPFGEVAERYRKAVADIAQESGKEIGFEVQGAETEIDKALADRLAEPLLHLVRNAADHGVEAPDVRLMAGKPRRARVRLVARRDAGFLLVRVEDDGRGVDPEAIRSRAVEEGMDLEEWERQGGSLLSLLLKPGFSLSRKVTKWSGRGVGLDAVDRSVRAARGSLRLESSPGAGFSSEIRLPLALSLVDGFTASAGGCDLLVPFETVDSCVVVGNEEGGDKATRRMVRVGDSLVPALDLSRFYGEPQGDSSIAILVNAGGSRVALLVDSVGEALSAAVRPLDRNLSDSPGVAGIAALGDGSFVLVLDAEELVALASGAATFSDGC